MARVAAILRGLARAVWREQQSLGSVAANNFFLGVVIFLQASGVFLIIVVGLLLLLPLSADPMRKIPRERLALWPLARREMTALRLGSIWLSPATWLVAALLFWASARFHRLGWQLLGLVIAANLASVAAAALFERRPDLSLFHGVPPFPGRLGLLVRKNIREMLSVLDPYLALAVALMTAAYRLLARDPQPEAFFAMSMLVVLAMSTYAQKLFALDLGGPFTRYRLLPIRGWEILFAKDLAFLAVAVPMTLLLEPLPALAALLVTLAVGHHGSVLRPMRQARWRFAGGTVFPDGVLQIVLLFGAGTLVREKPVFAGMALAVWAGSVWWYGRRLDRST